jgi:hypothetical protein
LGIVEGCCESGLSKLIFIFIPLNIIPLQPKKYLKLSMPYLLSLSTTY